MSASAQPVQQGAVAPEAPEAPEAPRLTWAAEALQAQLAPLLPGLTVQVVASLGSTNTELLARARAAGPGRAGLPGLPCLPCLPCLLVAERQTQGRGRHGKTWHAEAGSSLTFSLALPLTPADWSGLSLAVGLALAEAIDPMAADNASGAPASGATAATSATTAAAETSEAAAPPRIGLKWPNDLLLNTAVGAGKLGGILIETLPWDQAPGAKGAPLANAGAPAAAGTQATRLVVIGIGLNLQPPADTPTLAWGASGVQALHPGLSAPQLLARVAAPVLQAVLRFEHSGFAPLVAAYARRDVLQGRAVRTTLAHLPEGVADGVDAQGLLWLRHAGGRQALGSGEVSLRLVAGAAADEAPSHASSNLPGKTPDDAPGAASDPTQDQRSEPRHDAPPRAAGHRP